MVMMPASGPVFTSWMMVILCAYRCACVPVPPATQHSAAALCSPENRNPCQTFPTLCSAGGGLCVAKEPCEYQCLCPDGRLGRDCSRSSNPDPGSVVDTLLIFPKDMFADVNHVAKSEVFANTNRQNRTGTNRQNATETSTAEQKATTGFSITPTATWKETSTSTQQPTRTTAPGLANNNLPSSSGMPSSNVPVSVTPAPTPDVNTSVASILTPVPNHAQTIAVSSVSESFTKSTKDPGSVTSSQEQAWNSSKFTEKSTDASLLSEQSSVATAKALSLPASNVSFLLNLSTAPDAMKQSMNTKISSSTEQSQPLVAGNAPKTSTEPKAGSPTTVDTSTRLDVFNSGQADIIRTSIKHNVILSQASTSPSATVQPQQQTTQQHDITTTSATTNSPLSSTQDGRTSSQQAASTAATSTSQSTAVSEEFPTLFKLTLDSPLTPIDSGKNSALSMVVHRVFLPIDKFQPAHRSAH